MLSATKRRAFTTGDSERVLRRGAFVTVGGLMGSGLDALGGAAGMIGH